LISEKVKEEENFRKKKQSEENLKKKRIVPHSRSLQNVPLDSLTPKGN
jgi:hypothetical protein